MLKGFERKRGLIISIEGIDGAGKTTQSNKLKEYLEKEGYEVHYDSWNSGELVERVKEFLDEKAIKKAKKKRLLSPILYSLLHIVDFYDRLENRILPHRDMGKIVICDRYYYTSFARDIPRGIEPDWLKMIYRKAIRPDLAIYLQCPVEIALIRTLKDDLPNYYETGQDITLMEDPTQSFLLFQAKCKKVYDSIANEEGLVIVDASGSINEVFSQVKSVVDDFLKNKVKIDFTKNLETNDKEKEDE